MKKGQEGFTPKCKVFVGMSGGVDSSVAAALLQQAGYDVTGVFIKVWQADFLPCSWREERRDAMRAAAHLGIPFITLDLEREYRREVVDYMIREYGAGRIPNPDVMCNKHVKFGAFLDFARSRGADMIATGHYARIREVKSQKSKVNIDSTTYQLLCGKDKSKDQSYFLWTLTQEQLSRIIFPVGHLKKSQVRALAKKFGLPNAEKKDSQGLCFLGPVDMKDFLAHFIPLHPGDVLDEKGRVIGRHDGALLYTIGQRHGFTTEKTGPSGSPYYVVAKDLARNTITAGHELSGAAARIACALTEVNDMCGAFVGNAGPCDGKNGGSGEQLFARIRYRGALHPVEEIVPNGGAVTLRFAEAVEGIVAGQSVVLYRGEQCLGGGIVV